MAGTDPGTDRRRRRAERFTTEPAAAGQPLAVGGAAPDSRAVPDAASAVGAPAPLPGVVQIPTAEFARVCDLAAAPQRIATERARRDREDAVTAAVRAGKVTPFQGRQWAVLLEADPAAAAALAAIPDGASGVPLTEIGHAGRGQDTDQRTGWF